VGATAPVSATVMNDAAAKGVDWTATCGGGSSCGSFTPAHTASGATTTYTAPSPFTTNGTVSIVATATANTAKMASANVTVTAPAASNTPFWAQWADNPQHQGMVSVAGQGLSQQLANITYDPFVAQEQAENLPIYGAAVLTAHYQSPLIDGNDVYMLQEGGMYTSCNPPGAWGMYPFPACGPNAWNTKTWGEERFTWESGQLEPVWTYVSDWKPEPSGFGLYGWEPVFHTVDANSFIYVPGASGTVWKISKSDGSVTSHINPPFASVLSNPLLFNPANTYVASPLSADANGNIYYNVIQLADPSLGDPWFQNDVVAAWLVKVTSGDTATVVTYATLIPNAPPATGNCPGTFYPGIYDTSALPWPPSPTAMPTPVLCGSQRPGVNLAPAIGLDGTIYTGSRAHYDSLVSYLVAVNPDLTPKLVTSLENLLNDGCGVLVAIAPKVDPNQPNSCRNGANFGVDPTTNAMGSGFIPDQGSSTPTVLPDGSILFGVLTNYAASRGHLFKFGSGGKFLGAYDFGWDSTPAVYQHDGTYSIVIKDNHYNSPVYCAFHSPICLTLPPGPYYITQLDANLTPEWKFQSTNTESCHRNPDGSITCISDHPDGFEWCTNAPVVDANGIVYVNSEDGNLYTIPQGHSGVFTTPLATFFTQLALGAAYTPLSIGPDGKVYTENDGQMFVVGN
jgi:hypothetical protein